MQVYSYHPTHFLYTGTTEADESPLESGVYLIPAHATDVMPPAAKDGMHAVFDPTTQTWSEVPIPPPTNVNITRAPKTLFGGPSIKEITHGVR